MDDVISRQQAIDTIKYAGKIGKLTCIDILETLPPAQQRWIPFTKRDLTAEEREEHPEWCYIMECPLPDDGQEILVSNDRFVWVDTFYVDDGCYLDSDSEFEGCAWMPLPDPWKGEEE